MNQTLDLARYSKKETCPIRNVLDRIGDKWSFLILLLLYEAEVMRFKELQRTIGDVSQKMLTVTLKSLQADGLIERKVYAEVPPKVEYRLTELGVSLIPLLQNLAGWANINFQKIMESRSFYLKNRSE